MSTRSPLVFIRVDDRDIAAEDLRAVKSVKITSAENKADTGEIVFWDKDTRIFDSRTYRKGASLTFIMGWADALEVRGPYVVKSQSPNFPDKGSPTLTVTFQDSSHRMNRQQRQRRFSNVTPAQVIRQIATEHDLGYEIEDPENVRFTDDFPLLQVNTTDARLLQQLAERYGYVWGVEGGNLYFRRPVELTEVGQQSEVPVLSYRINDWSLASFKPEIKFMSGRRRRGAAQTSGNVDFMQGTSENNGVFQVLEAGREAISSAMPQLDAVVRALPGQDVDDDEPQGSQVRRTDTQGDRGDQRVERTRGLQRYDRTRQVLDPERFPERPETEDEHEENTESEPGDASGAATPATEDEAQRRAAGRSVRASELIEAAAVPSVASMRWRSSMAVVIAGVGERLSGQYRVAEVTQTIEQTFKTNLRVKRQTFRPSTQDSARISQAAADAEEATSREQPSAEGPPPRTTQAEQMYLIDRDRTRLGRRYTVNGQEQR